MKTATINFKTDENTKKRAQVVADAVGIPLSNLLNAYITDLATTGQVHFMASEPMTSKMEELIEQSQNDIALGEVSGPFYSTKSLMKHLNSP